MRRGASSRLAATRSKRTTGGLGRHAHKGERRVSSESLSDLREFAPALRRCVRRRPHGVALATRTAVAQAFRDRRTRFSGPRKIYIKELIQAITPDVLVKGGDYTVEQVVGADEVIGHGGEVKIVPLVKGYSTSALIETIRRL